MNFSLKNWPEMTYFGVPFLTSGRQLQWFGKRQLLSSVLQHTILGEEEEVKRSIEIKLLREFM